MDFYQSETENLIRRAVNLAVRNFFNTELPAFVETSAGKARSLHGVARSYTEFVRWMDQFGREKGISIRKKQIIDFQF